MVWGINGHSAANNAELVGQARAMAEELGSPVLTAEQFKEAFR